MVLALNGRMAEAMSSLLTVGISGYSEGDELSEGAQFSSECLDELPKNNPLIEQYSTPIASALTEREKVLQEICAIWSPDETILKETFFQSFETEALILGGLLLIFSLLKMFAGLNLSISTPGAITAMGKLCFAIRSASSAG